MASPADSFRGGGGGGKSSSPGLNNLEALGAGEAGAGDPLPGEPPPRLFTPLGDDAAVRNDDFLANLEKGINKFKKQLLSTELAGWIA